MKVFGRTVQPPWLAVVPVQHDLGESGPVEKYRQDIRQRAAARGVEYLLHFTPSENIASILAHGLHSRHSLLEAGVAFLATDAHRMDGRPESISLSVRGINADMLRAKRQDHDGWVIVAINASILWTHSCRFCWRNAAKKEVADTRGFLGGPWGFERMFAEPHSGLDRAALGRQSCEPTDPSAEVQVFDPIAPELFLALVVEREAHRTILTRHLQEVGMTLPVHVEAAVFT